MMKMKDKYTEEFESKRKFIKGLISKDELDATGAEEQKQLEIVKEYFNER